MKKLYFLPLLILLTITFSKISFSQFQGMIEIKETSYSSSKAAKENSMYDMIPAEAKEEIKKQIQEKETELKNKPKTDEDYEELANELKMMKEQLGMTGSSSASTESKPNVDNIKMYILGNNIRTETFEESKTTGAAIINVKDKKIIAIMEDEKKYMEIDFETMKQMANAFKNMKTDQPKSEERTESKSNIKRTGKTKVILGYKCDEYIMEDEETSSVAWICPDFTNFWKTFSEIGKSFEMDKTKGPNDWFTDAVGETGFPFKATEKTKDGKMISEWEITKIDKSKPDASLFAPPKGYTKMDMNSMFNAK